MKTKRSLSGIYYRYQNPNTNKWENWCFEDLPTKDQQVILDNNIGTKFASKLAIALANCINRLGEEFNLTTEK